MSSDLHKKEAQAIRALRNGVARYAEDIREAIRLTRREIAVADQRIQQELERRRLHLARADHDLKHIQQALRRASVAERAELELLAASAIRRQVDARRRLEKAREASRMAKEAQYELLKVASHVEGKVGEHSSVAASALAALDDRMHEYSHGPNPIQVAAVTVGAVLNLASNGQGLVRTSGDFAKAVGIDHSLVEQVRHKTLAEYSSERDQDMLGLYADKRLEEVERRGNSEIGGGK